MSEQIINEVEDLNFSNMEQKKQDRKLFNSIGVALTVLVVLVLALQSVFGIVVNIINPELWKLPWMTWLMIIVGFHLTAFPVFCILMKKLPSSPKGEAKTMKIGKVIRLFIIGMATLYLFNLISVGINYLIGMLKGSPVANPYAATVEASNIFFTFLVAGIIAPIIEEILFRGILLDKLRVYGEKVAIWVTAIAFGLFHLNTSQSLYATALGVLLAYVAVKTNRVKYCIILHMAINIMGSLIVPLLLTAGYAGAIGVIVLFFLIAGIILFIRMKKNPIVEDGGEQPVVQSVSKAVIFGNPGMIAYISVCLIVIVATALR